MPSDSQQHAHFNLVDEPWIVVKTLSQQVEELSLTSLFDSAHEIESLANETAQQDFALLRVLLAILQRSISPSIEEDDDPAEVWGSLWNEKRLPVDSINSYLNEWHDRFDLFDEAFPFMQVAGLESTTRPGDCSKLLFVSGNKGQLMPTRTGERRTSLSFAEAARWLVTAQAYDVSGNKSHVEGASMPAKGTGWAGKLGGVYAEGRSLKETLVLNLVLWGKEWDECFSEQDTPVWERGNASCYPDEREPTGPADLYSWQSRRVRIIPQDNCISEVILTVGDMTNPIVKNKEYAEYMTAWKREGRDYKPLPHSQGRAMWRGLDALLPSGSGNEGEHEPDKVKSPGVVEWLNYLSSANGGRRLPPGYVLRLHGVGIQYASKQSSIDESIDDYVGMHAFLLSPDGQVADEAIRRCVKATDAAVESLGSLAANLVFASGFTKPKPDGKATRANAPQEARETARADAYFEIDSEFRTWLLTIDRKSDLVACQQRWAKTLRTILGRAADALITRAGTAAIVGRQQIDGWMSASVAEGRFYKGLKEALQPIELNELGERKVAR